jgi:hypothetical protein
MNPKFEKPMVFRKIALGKRCLASIEVSHRRTTLEPPGPTTRDHATTKLEPRNKNKFLFPLEPQALIGE